MQQQQQPMWHQTNQAEDMMTPAVRHHSGHICSKQGELKIVTNTIKTETNSKLTGKTTNTSTLPVGRTSQPLLRHCQNPTDNIHWDDHPSKWKTLPKQNTDNRHTNLSDTDANMKKVTEAAKDLLLLNMDENTDYLK